MKDLIGCCGLDCEKCEARIATINNDDDERVRIAKLWSSLNKVEITPEMINCLGCRLDGVKTPFCNSLCPIRNCSMSKKFNTCGSCDKIDNCETLNMVVSNNKEALKNLKDL